MKHSDHFGSCNGNCGCESCNDKGMPDSSMGSYLSGFGDHGFDAAPKQTGLISGAMGQGDLFEKIVSQIEAPCEAGGVFSAIFGAVMGFVSAPVAPLGGLIGAGLCALLRSEEGRQKMVLDMHQALKLSLARDPSRFIAMNIGVIDTVVEWYDILKAQGKLMGRLVGPPPHPAAVWVLPRAVRQQQSSMIRFPTIGPVFGAPRGNIGGVPYGIAYTPAGEGEGWERLVSPKSELADQTLRVFSEAFVIAQASTPCTEDVWFPFTFAYIYAMNWQQLKRMNRLDMYDSKYIQGKYAHMTSLRDWASSYDRSKAWKVFFAPIGDLSRQVQQMYDEAQNDYFADISEGRTPKVLKCTVYGKEERYKKYVSDYVGIDQIFEIARMAAEAQALSAAHARNPRRYAQLLAENPNASAYLKEQMRLHSEIYGASGMDIGLSKFPFGLLIGGGGLIGLALIAARRR